MQPSEAAPPVNPYLVLGAAIVLPGSGHVLLGLAARGLQFIFFIVILAWITTKFAPPGATFIGRHAGGVLIYALSILDAYRVARFRHARWSMAGSSDPRPGAASDEVAK